jgi:hypothetical protein
MQRHFKLKHNGHGNAVDIQTKHNTDQTANVTGVCSYPLLKHDATYYKRFTTPTTICISGATGSGKTWFLFKLLQHRKVLFYPDIHKILYCYGVWQPLFERMEQSLPIEFHRGIPSEHKIDTFSDALGNVVILDDLMSQSIDNKNTESLFTRGSHHQNLTVIFISQNLFCQGKCARNIALNTHYMVLMKNPRDISQISVLARQTGMGKQLTQAYEECMGESYGYLIVDLSPRNEHAFKLKTAIFPDENTHVFI